MKRATLFLILFLITQNILSQEYYTIFLGEDFIQYKGSLFKCKTITSPLVRQFYNNLENCQSALDNNVIYPHNKQKGRTLNDSLINKIFIVERIINKAGDDFSIKDGFTNGPIFILADTLTKEKIYYRYNPFNADLFPFYVANLSFDNELYCKKIEFHYDEFSKTKGFYSPSTISNNVCPLSIHKMISNNQTSYYLNIKAFGNTPVVDGEDVIVLFKDGTQWVRNMKIEVDVNKNDIENKPYIYSAFIPLTNKDLEIFCLKKIDKYRLYVFDEYINFADSEIYRIYFNCLKKKI